ncbi:hypothetical protein BU23DRAFT_570151 [Bimuria novae-zelandiae CBS 107.79]|uniref:Extracellular membrane protein CFEM domain-containing protein n=1 Tax=Bimuria novae-zelandiae CBS 107.79 TaxID=1447943 RepID=A0A6A5V230_9PLEO|nr:hypothetical protein BU23DRAFT_570151 [Bimuria novae-zelandiae CBS 107.79]
MYLLALLAAALPVFATGRGPHPGGKCRKLAGGTLGLNCGRDSKVPCQPLNNLNLNQVPSMCIEQPALEPDAKDWMQCVKISDDSSSCELNGKILDEVCVNQECVEVIQSS